MPVQTFLFGTTLDSHMLIGERLGNKCTCGGPELAQSFITIMTLNFMVSFALQVFIINIPEKQQQIKPTILTFKGAEE